MCLSAPNIPTPTPPPVAPPTFIASPPEVAEPTKIDLGGPDSDSRRRKRRGRGSLVNSLNIPGATSTSTGSGLNIPT